MDRGPSLLAFFNQISALLCAKDFGIFVNVGPRIDGLVHTSRLGCSAPWLRFADRVMLYSSNSSKTSDKYACIHDFLLPMDLALIFYFVDIVKQVCYEVVMIELKFTYDILVCK